MTPHRFSGRRGAVALAAAAFAASVHAQQPAPQNPPTFQSGTQVVEVDVRVFGKDGKFITDLRPEDFEVKEEGAPQHVVSLTLVGGAPVAPAPLAPAPLAPAPSAPLAPLAPVAPVAPSAPSVWVFVFDTGHLSQGGIERTRKAVVQFLQEKFRDGDIGGIVADGKMANNRLTSVRAELVKAASDVKQPDVIFRYQTEMTREWPKIQDEFEAWQIAVQNDSDALARAVTRACTEDPDACKGSPPDGMIKNKCQSIMTQARASTDITLRSVAALSNGLARMPGPKTVVFLSEGFVTLDTENAVRNATGMANRAGAHFYTIDARGLNKGRGSSIIDQKIAFDSAGAFGGFDAQEDGTNALAVDTGGMAIRNENNFGRALDEIQSDAGTYYVLGYTPANQTLDGKYRAIAVTVNRPGVKVRARRGYLALEPAKLIKPAPIKTPTPSATAPPVSAAPAADSPASSTAAPPEPATSTSTPAPPAATEPAAPSPETARLRSESNGLVESLRNTPAVRLAPAGGDDLARQGWAAYQKGDVEHASEYLRQAGQVAGGHPWIRYALGFAELAQQHYPDAAKAWELVRIEVPDFEPVYFNLADAYMLQHDDGGALRVLKDATRRWPQDAEAWNAIGVLHIRRKALDAAVDAFTHATTVAPGESLGYFNLARAYQMRAATEQRYDKARERWVGGESDLKKAAAGYEEYIRIGGPYVQQAKQALQALDWK